MRPPVTAGQRLRVHSKCPSFFSWASSGTLKNFKILITVNCFLSQGRVIKYNFNSAINGSTDFIDADPKIDGYFKCLFYQMEKQNLL